MPPPWENRKRIDGCRVVTPLKTTEAIARVEHVFGTIKGVFGFRKVRYRGLAKNRHHVQMLAALANLFTWRRRLLAT